MQTTKKRKVEMKKAIGFSRYSIDTINGRVFDEETKRWKVSNPNANGYCYVNVVNDIGFKEAMGLHRLIYMAHTGESIPEGMQVDHIDNDRANNKIENLELVTHLENMRRRKEKNKNFKKLNKKEEQWLEEQFQTMNFYHGNKMDKFKILASELGVSVRAIQYRHKDYAGMVAGELA